MQANTLPDANLKAGFTNSATFFTNKTDGVMNLISLADEMLKNGYTDSSTATAVNKDEVEQTIDGQKVMVTPERHMINKSVANPTMLVYIPSTTHFSNNWIGRQIDLLWGNPEGFNYPKMSQTYKSVFDPCPNGYRIVPKDIWINFLVDLTKSGNKYYFNVKGAFNKGYNMYYKGMGTTELNNLGEAIAYVEPKDGLIDFYICDGYRVATQTGVVSGVGASTTYWCSTPNGSAGGALGYWNTSLNVQHSYSRSYGLGIRCTKEN